MVLDIVLLVILVLAVATATLFVRRRPRVTSTAREEPIPASRPVVPDEATVVPDRSRPPSLEGVMRRSSGRFRDLRRRLGGLDRDVIFQTMEEVLLESDLGPTLTAEVLDEVRRGTGRGASAEDLWQALRRALRARLLSGDRSIAVAAELPTVVLVVGVNGAGKTTTVGKLAARLRERGDVVIAAADTFRAAATEQVSVWAERSGVRLVAGQQGADPGAVVFDAVEAAKARGAAVVVCDTAGRLQNKANLMAELGKVRRVAEKAAGHVDEVLLVVDATTGQNGLSQARVFGEVTGLTGVVLTKLDGSAKGGIALAIEHEFKVPVKLVGVGEALEDLQPFDPDDFVDALLDMSGSETGPGSMRGDEADV